MLGTRTALVTASMLSAEHAQELERAAETARIAASAAVEAAEAATAAAALIEATLAQHRQSQSKPQNQSESEMSHDSEAMRVSSRTTTASVTAASRPAPQNLPAPSVGPEAITAAEPAVAPASAAKPPRRGISCQSGLEAEPGAIERQTAARAPNLNPAIVFKATRSLVGFAHQPDMLLHHGREHHPEKPERITVALDRLHASDLLKSCHPLNSERHATDEELLAVHTSGHLKRVATAARAVEDNPDDQALREPHGDGAIYYHEMTERSARCAAGSVLEAVDATLRGEVHSAYALVRPPGHHAEADEALGFCFYNSAVSTIPPHAAADTWMCGSAG